MSFKDFIKPTKGKIILTILQGIIFFIAKRYHSMMLCDGCTVQSTWNNFLGTISSIFSPFFVWLINRSGTPLNQEADIILWGILTLVYWYLIACIIIAVYKFFKK